MKNEQALNLFENNQIAEAMLLFEEAVAEKRTVQALNNLAWMYLYEKEDPERAKPLLEEVIKQNPQSHFPYNMLGEIAVQQKEWNDVKEILQKAIDLFPSDEAIHNLAVAQYYTGDFETASQGFHQLAKDSDLIQWFEVLALIYNQNETAAKAVLDEWNDQSDDYTGAIEAADAYTEINCLKEAKVMFEKEWKEYVVSPYVISRYAYVLFQLNEWQACEEMIRQETEKKSWKLKMKCRKNAMTTGQKLTKRKE